MLSVVLFYLSSEARQAAIPKYVVSAKLVEEMPHSRLLTLANSLVHFLINRYVQLSHLLLRPAKVRKAS